MLQQRFENEEKINAELTSTAAELAGSIASLTINAFDGTSSVAELTASCIERLKDELKELSVQNEMATEYRQELESRTEELHLAFCRKTEALVGLQGAHADSLDNQDKLDIVIADIARQKSQPDGKMAQFVNALPHSRYGIYKHIRSFTGALPATRRWA